MCDNYLRQAINYMAQNDECKFPETAPITHEY